MITENSIGTFEDLTAEIGRGFGKTSNRYAWSLTEFDGYLYVGTLNFFEGGEIWRISLEEQNDQQEWVQVLDFDASVEGIREMAIYQDQIYAFTSGNDSTGPSAWFSSDGTSWTEITGGPLGNAENSSIRTSIVHDGLLYVGTGDGGTGDGTGNGAEVWTYDGTTWTLVEKFSSETTHISEFIEFNETLYVGTWNDSGSYFYAAKEDGFEDVTPSFGGRRFESNNRGVMDSVVFQDELYLTTFNWINGFSLLRTEDPLTGQWEIVTRNGFGDADNAYGWSMAVYDDPLTATVGDELYLGTFNNGFRDGNSIPFDGLAQLYSTTDGENWTLVDDDGLGAPLTWGIRNMLVTSDQQLVLGTASNFIVPESAVEPGDVGAQVWVADL